jgi:hypothetical protein
VAQVAVVEAQPLDLLLQSLDFAGQIRDSRRRAFWDRGLAISEGDPVIHGLNHGCPSGGIPAPNLPQLPCFIDFFSS